MHVLPSLLLAASIFDFMPASVITPVPAPKTAYASTGAGELTVSLEDATPVGAVPRGATNVPMGILNLSASCDADITVQSIDLTHIGMGRSADIAAIFVSTEGRRISRSQRFDRSSGRASVAFRSLVVKRCDAVRLQILATIASDADAAGEHGILLRSPSDIQASSQRITIIDADSARRVITSPVQDSAITVHFLPIASRFLYGRIETLARIQLSSDSRGSHLLKRILLTNRGSARNYDFTDLRLETRTGKVLTTVIPGMREQFLSLEFMPSYIVKSGDSVVLLLKGTVHASWRRTVEFTLEEDGDLLTNPYTGE